MCSPWLVLRDLDRAECAPSLLASIAGGDGGIIRIAVRATEAWLLADREGAAAWLGMSVSKMPVDVERLDDPKRALINLARRSRSRTVRVDLVPRATARIGPGYVDQVRRFCRELWRPDVAALSAPSLARCLLYVQRR